MAKLAIIPAAFPIYCTSFYIATILHKAFRVPSRQKTHSPLVRGDKYLSYYLCFLLTLFSSTCQNQIPYQKHQSGIKEVD